MCLAARGFLSFYRRFLLFLCAAPGTRSAALSVLVYLKMDRVDKAELAVKVT